MIKAALNGRRVKADHANIPITAEELTASAKEVLQFGAKEIHFHVRDSEGNETLEYRFVSDQVKAIKEALPAIPVGISTGEWIEPVITKRIDLIRGWNYLPDFVSVNGDEEGFESIIHEILKKGIRIEAGISNMKAAKSFKELNLLQYCFRILLEPGNQDFPRALSDVEEIENYLSDEFAGKSILLHGFDKTCWAFMHVAKKKEYDCRMGFEDTLTLSNGILAKTNGELIQDVVLLFK
jgi:uncharacterized protein (DUF849 family)